MNTIQWLTFPEGWYTPLLAALTIIWALAMLLDDPVVSLDDS